MKKTAFLCMLLVLASCKPTQKTIEVKNQTQLTSSVCIENASCVLSLIPNKSIEYKTDEFGNVSHQIIEGKKTVLAYTLTKNPIENVEDSFYKEMIFAELDSPLTEINLTNEDLQLVNLYFGRFCYCKGETGFFPIKKGSFSISNITQNSALVTIQFQIEEVPHLVNTVIETIIIN